MAKQSYFAEMRIAKNDPNFFMRMNVDEIRKSVKRIIKDIKFDNIQDQDYSYFINTNVMSACLCESYEQWYSASVILNALNYYINDGLGNGYRPYKSTDITNERAKASAEQLKQNARCYLWMHIYLLFYSIYKYNAPITQTLKSLQTMNFNVNDL